MNSTEIKIGHRHILYDADQIENVTPEAFDISHWKKKDALVGFANGRGTTYFVDINNTEYVLRHYRRGGAMIRLSADRYLWLGVEKTRSWAEWRLLGNLYKMGLPVPAPLAALAVRTGPFYRADILLKRLVGAEPLAVRLTGGGQPAELWHSVGSCVRRFHDAGLDHQDLNASNILCDDQFKVHLIDFDKCLLRQTGGNGWQKANLARLHRSLIKFKSRLIDFYFSEADWSELERGYRGA